MEKEQEGEENAAKEREMETSWLNETKARREACRNNRRRKKKRRVDGRDGRRVVKRGEGGLGRGRGWRSESEYRRGGKVGVRGRGGAGRW